MYTAGKTWQAAFESWFFLSYILVKVCIGLSSVLDTETACTEKCNVYWHICYVHIYYCLHKELNIRHWHLWVNSSLLAWCFKGRVIDKTIVSLAKKHNVEWDTKNNFSVLYWIIAYSMCVTKQDMSTMFKWRNGGKAGEDPVSEIHEVGHKTFLQHS